MNRAAAQKAGASRLRTAASAAGWYPFGSIGLNGEERLDHIDTTLCCRADFVADFNGVMNAVGQRIHASA